MAKAWMPMYWGDYLIDTAHLTTEQHGAYLMLIAHYWVKNGLPNDDDKLARIAGLPRRRWLAMKTTISEFFSENWKHKRIEFELTEAARISAAGRAGGLASGISRRSRSTIVQRSFNDRTNDSGTNREALQSQSQSQEDKKEKKEPGKTILPVSWTPSADHFLLGKERGLSEREVSDAVGEMRDWSIGNGERRRNWDSVFSNWLRRNAKRRNGNGRQFQDNGLSVSRAADKIIEATESGSIQFSPRPKLVPDQSESNIRLLSKR